jgi:hypothetical protein
MAAIVGRVAAQMKMETSTRKEKAAATQQRKAARALMRPGGFSNLTF